MDIFQFLTLAGGLSLFLFGMNVMGQALERRAGSKLRSLLGTMTSNRAAGLITGLVVTAVIQSSSATTVMVVGFVNSNLMTLRQAIHVIMGANVGTTVTAWILSLAGIDSGNIFVEFLKPSSFTPILAVVGIVYYMFCKSDRKKDTGLILLGFATLMFGMDTMSGAVAGLRDLPAFQNLFLLFRNPILGVLAGAVLTAIIQSSSASVGILQALAVTGQVTYGAAIPIIMGQNIGTCVTAMLSSIGANRNARRAAMVHLSFNVIGTAVWLSIFCLIRWLMAPALLDESASLLGIAVAHSIFNVLCTILMLPMSRLLERLVCRLVPDDRKPEPACELDERLLGTPPMALERCRKVAAGMAGSAVFAMECAMDMLRTNAPEMGAKVRKAEEQTDHDEDILSTYLVKLSTLQISAADSNEAAKLLKIIGDFERIADHAVSIVASVEEMNEKDMTLSADAKAELWVLLNAVHEILGLSLQAFQDSDLQAAAQVEPLEQVIDDLKEQLRTAHILRLQREACSIGAGFVWSDLLTDLERVSDHCANVAGCVMDMSEGRLNLHASLRARREALGDYTERYAAYSEKYTLPKGEPTANFDTGALQNLT